MGIRPPRERVRLIITPGYSSMTTLMGDLVGQGMEEQIVQRDENSWLIDGGTPIDDVMTHRAHLPWSSPVVRLVAIRAPACTAGTSPALTRSYTSRNRRRWEG